MEITSTTLILVSVICIVLGFFASVLLNTLRDEDSQPLEDEVQAPPGGKKGRYTPVARLWREKKTGSIVVETEGRSFVNVSGLSESQREEMEKVARDFRGWLGMGMAAQAQPAQPALKTVMQTALPVHQPINTPTANVIPPAPTSSPTPFSQKLPAVTVQPVTTPAVSSGPKSIVMQIEDILQDMIATGPMANRVIHLFEDPLRGVMVSVGSQTYEGIDNVPDQDVKATIRAAVAEWEKSQ